MGFIFHVNYLFILLFEKNVLVDVKYFEIGW